MTLALPDGINETALLGAIMDVESSGGVNNCPRFERAYMPAGFRCTVQGLNIVGTGRNYNELVKSRWSVWGLASSASYSPWQILYHTAADAGYGGAPWLLWDPAIAIEWVKRSLQFKINRQKLTTVAEIADAWNSGSARDTFIPQEYVDHVLAAYAKRGA